MVNGPMVMANWYGAAAHCTWRSQQEGKEQCYDLSTWDCDFAKHGYHLPAEAEWDYAARGGLSGRRFPWGDAITHSQANYWSKWTEGHPYYSYDVNPTERYHPLWNDGIKHYTFPVGSFAPNNYGLYDMAGNVGQWCSDWYSDVYCSSSTGNNPPGPTSGSSRVTRSGGWVNEAGPYRVAARNYNRPDRCNSHWGFRVVLDLN